MIGKARTPSSSTIRKSARHRMDRGRISARPNVTVLSPRNASARIAELPRLDGTRETFLPAQSTDSGATLGPRPLRVYLPEQFGELRFQPLERRLLPLAPQAVDSSAAA